MQQLAEEVEMAERSAGCWCWAVHLKRTGNVISDKGSLDIGFVQRWSNDPWRDAVLSRSVFQPIDERWGPFQIDLVADRVGVTAVAPSCMVLPRIICL